MTQTSSCPLDLQTASEAVRRHAGDQAPAALRLMAARGRAPMAPRDLVTTQYALTFDADPKIAQAAQEALADIDPRLANAVLSDAAVAPQVLGYIARIQATNDGYVERLLLNPSTPTDVFADVALVCSEPIAELIANNQARLLDLPQIVLSFAQNPNVLKSTRDRVIDFLVREGKVLDGHEFEEALLRLGADERLAAARHIEIPPELQDERSLSPEELEARRDRKLIDEDEEGTEDELDNLPLEERLRRLPLPHLVAYATRGNKQVRKMLMRHTNRIVALAAVTSPMVQEPEIIEAANSKVTHQDAIAHIAKDKKNNWTRNYQVKLGLVQNPKTPLPEAMKLVPHLNPRDVKLLAKSKNVPMGVRNMANNLSRRGGKR